MHRVMHQGAWLAWASGAGVVAIATTNPFYLVPLCAAAYLVHSVHGRIDPRHGSFRMFVLFGLATVATRTVLVVFGPVDAGNITAAFFEGARLAVLMIVFGAYNSVADPFAVLKLAPRRFHEAALAAALALSLAPRTIGAVTRVREAQKLRGLYVSGWRSIPALAVPVLETGMEEAVMLAESMDARGHGRGRRSRYRPERWGPSSVVTAAAAASAVLLVAVAAQSGDGHLSMPTFPLTWPGASPIALAAVMVLAAPALFPGASRDAA